MIGQETVKTIATRLGISHSTVSRALNPNKKYLVASDTQRKVEVLARSLQYRPSGIARSLRENRSNLIGFYSASGYGLEGEFALTVVIQLQNTCEIRKQHLLLLTGELSSQRLPPAETLAAVFNSKVDGLVVHAPPEDTLIARLVEDGFPMIAISDAPPGVPIVRVDDAGIRLALDHLLSQGYRRIAFVGANSSLPALKRRRNAYKAFCQENDLSSDIIAGPMLDFELPLSIWYSRLPAERPDAFCCWCDMTAYGLRRACMRSGLSVPADVAITGFDGFRDYKNSDAALTTMIAPWANAAMIAGDLILQRIAGESVPDETVLPVTLQHGATV